MYLDQVLLLFLNINTSLHKSSNVLEISLMFQALISSFVLVVYITSKGAYGNSNESSSFTFIQIGNLLDKNKII